MSHIVRLVPLQKLLPIAIMYFSPSLAFNILHEIYLMDSNAFQVSCLLTSKCTPGKRRFSEVRMN